MLTRFAEGQIWKYQTREHEPDSRIVVVRVDADDEEYGSIIHIYITNVDIPNKQAPQGKTTFIGHLPYTDEALEDSVTELESQSDDLPEFEEGYRLWHEAFQRQEAGVFDIPVCDAIDFVEESLTES